MAKIESLEEVFTKWELGRYEDLESARSFAISKGWRATPQRVQIRVEKINNKINYVIEPFETDCNCPNIIRPF